MKKKRARGKLLTRERRKGQTGTRETNAVGRLKRLKAPSVATRSLPTSEKKKKVGVGAVKGQLKELEKKLLERRQEITEMVVCLKKDIDSGESENTGDLSTLPQHLADLGSQEYDQSLNFTLTESAEQELRSIDNALWRIQEGQYGTCEQCEQFIDLERLKALPFTTQCIACKTQEEK